MEASKSPSLLTLICDPSLPLPTPAPPAPASFLLLTRKKILVTFQSF